MKILFVISSIGIGGEARVLSILSRKMCEYGNEISIFTLSNTPRKEMPMDGRVNIIKSESDSDGNKLQKNLCRIKELKKLARTEKFDVAVGFASRAAIVTTISLKGIVPVIVAERNDPRHSSKLFQILRHTTYHFCNGGVFQTQRQYNIFPYIRKKVVIHNPLDASKLPDTSDRNPEKTVVSTSRLMPQKNLKLLIDAFTEASKNCTDYRLEMYGDGYLKDELEGYIESKSMSSKIKILPATPDILKIIVNKSIFVLSSDYEGFPNSLAEALAIGLPCISTDCPIGGPEEMIDSGKNGLLVKTGDVDELADALNMLMNDEKMRLELGEAARNIAKELDEDAITKQWLSFFKEVTDSEISKKKKK